MSRVVITEGAAFGLERCRRFLATRNPIAARRAGLVIARQLALLDSMPEAGRLVDGQPHLRELVIGFGATGYIALYRHVAADDTVYVLAFRHQREAGY